MNRSERSARIIATYRDAMSLVDAFAREVYEVACEPCIESDTSHGKEARGCCTMVDMAYEHITGPAADDIRELSAQASAGRMATTKISCIYHDAESGCMLGDLKPPVCASFYCDDARKRLSRDLGIYVERPLLMQPLDAILRDELREGSHPVRGADGVIMEGVNPETLASFRRYIIALTERARTVQSSRRR